MSHDTFIRSVPIWDIRALRSAVSDLRERGVNVELQEGGSGRMYESRKLRGEYVLKLQNSRYDVVLTRGGEGSPLVPVCDLMGSEVARQLGWTDYKVAPLNVDGTAKTRDEMQEERQMAAIGKFAQAYSNFATINAVVDAGHTIIEQSVTADGELMLSYV